MLTAAVMAEVMGGRLESSAADRAVTGFSIDSRTLRDGDWFFAIRGDRFDGHTFVSAAFDRGAAGVVVSAPADKAPRGVAVITVPDTVVALQRLARYVRRESGTKVTAITGSAGKTTTKEIAASFLERRYSVFRNPGNLNNHLGLPLSLLELRHRPQMAVVELGMNHPGEIRTLVGIAEPDVRVWTNVGPAHLEFFGSLEAIADAKAEVCDGASRTSVLVANGDDPLVMARASGFAGRVVTFGFGEGVEIRADDVVDRGIDGTQATVRAPAGEVRLECPLLGLANLSNVLAGAAVAVQFGVELTEVAAAAPALRPMPHRGEVLRLRNDIVVLDDSYNSNPAALERALGLLARAGSPDRRVAVIGEMLELGPASGALHEECGRTAVRLGVDRLVTVGGEPARALGRAAVDAGLRPEAVHHCATAGEASALVGGVVRDGDVVLVKGSRGIRMETVVAGLEAESG